MIQQLDETITATKGFCTDVDHTIGQMQVLLEQQSSLLSQIPIGIRILRELRNQAGSLVEQLRTMKHEAEMLEAAKKGKSST